MEKYYGILMDRIVIVDGVYVYKPEAIVKGNLRKINDTVFIDEMGQEYLLMGDKDTYLLDQTQCIYNPISESDLRKKYPNNEIRESALFHYYESFVNVYIGICTIDELEDELDLENELDDDVFVPTINIVILNITQVIDALKSVDFAPKEETTTAKDVSYDDKVFMSIDKFRSLLEIKDLKILKEELQKMISSVEEINSYFMETPEPGSKEYYKMLFKAIKDYILNINNIEEMKEAINQIEDVYLNLTIDLDQRKEEGTNIDDALNFVYELSANYDELLEMEDLNDIKEKACNIYDKEEERLNNIIGKFEEDKLEKEIDSKKEEKKEKINVREMKEFFDKKIIGQEEAKIDVISALFMNDLKENDKNKNNVLLVGPTGSGKTLIAEATSDYLSKPMEIIDTTQITMPGYVGANIEDYLERLMVQAKGNLEKAEHGIVVFDEIDKKGSPSNGDVAGKGVLNTLLPFLQGTTYDIKYNGRIYRFKTDNLTIFATGAFTDTAEANDKSNTIGFGTKDESKKQDIEYKKLTNADFIKKGNMPAELIGRFATITQLSGHTKESLKAILTNSNASALLAEKEKLETIGVELSWTDDYLDAVAEKALKLKTGARSLKTTVEESVKKVRWEVISNLEKYTKIILTENTVENNLDCVLVDIDGNEINLKDTLKKEQKVLIKK